MTYFGDYLREARGSKSLSQAATLIGCTKAHLWELEAGRTDNPGIKLMAGMSRAYCIQLECLAAAWEHSANGASPAGRKMHPRETVKGPSMTQDREALQSLLSRVEGAEGADRELDCALWALDTGYKLVWRGNSLVAGTHGIIGWIDPGEHSRNFSCIFNSGPGHVEQYTASLDAALALCSRVLPGWWWAVSHGCDVGQGAFWGKCFNNYQPGEARIGWDGPGHATEYPGKTPALALIAAMLGALIAQAAGPESLSVSQDEPNLQPQQDQAKIIEQDPSLG